MQVTPSKLKTAALLTLLTTAAQVQLAQGQVSAIDSVAYVGCGQYYCVGGEDSPDCTVAYRERAPVAGRLFVKFFADYNGTFTLDQTVKESCGLFQIPTGSTSGEGVAYGKSRSRYKPDALLMPLYNASSMQLCNGDTKSSVEARVLLENVDRTARTRRTVKLAAAQESIMVGVPLAPVCTNLNLGNFNNQTHQVTVRWKRTATAE